jgi:hypothetical protein
VIFWVIALAMAAWLAVILSTGEIRGRRNILLVDRSTNPTHYWFCVAGVAVVLLGSIVQAIAPPY